MTWQRRPARSRDAWSIRRCGWLAHSWTIPPVGTLVHTDLHHENVLHAVGDGGERGPWLVIDPKPMSGDPHYELAPMLFNRWDDVIAGGDVRDAVRRRFHTLVDSAGLDEHRARDWVVVREVINAMWAVEDDDHDDVTMHLAVAKAVQD